MNKIEIGAIYNHYKGTKVKVLWEGFHSETLESVVIYMHLEDGVVWVRPKKVKVNDKPVPRFKKINQKILIKPKKQNETKR